MEIVGLNERLRGDFTPLLKLVPLRALAGEKGVAPPSEAAPALVLPPAESADPGQFAQHLRVMLWRLNSYQYGSMDAFRADLAQLEQVSAVDPQREAVRRILERLAAAGSDQEATSRASSYSSDGATVVLGHSGVRGVQQATATATAADSDCPWRCNVALRDVTVTISSFASQGEALQGYEQQRAAMATSPLAFTKLCVLGHSRNAAQQEADAAVLRAAQAQCHPRLTSSRVSAPATSSTIPTLTSSSTPSKAPKPTAKIALAAPASSCPSPDLSVGSGSPPRALARAKAPEPSRSGAPHGQKRAKSPEQRSFLRLRRLIQKKLCRHLKGREVCVMVSPDRAQQEQDEAKWRASGRLEAGKVHSYARKKQISFADYVKDELGYTASACPHMFLVRTRESIDDHLKVCDVFTDEDREELGKNLSGSVKSFVQAKSRKRRR